MGGKIFEIINAKIDNSSANIELELLETKFKAKMKKIGTLQGHTLANVKSGDVVSTELIDDITTKQEELEIKIIAYETEIVNYAATKDIQITFETRTKQDFSKEYASFELLNELVSREEYLMNRIQNIRKVLGDMALLGKIKSIDEIIESITDTTNENYKLLAIHPSLKLAVFSCYEEYGQAYVTQSGPVYYYKAFKIQIRNLNTAFSAGSVVAERVLYSPDNQTTTLIHPSAGLEFSSLGDTARLTANKNDGTVNENIDEIVDFSEYGMALSPNWQGVTLAIIEGRG